MRSQTQSKGVFPDPSRLLFMHKMCLELSFFWSFKKLLSDPGPWHWSVFHISIPRWETMAKDHTPEAAGNYTLFQPLFSYQFLFWSWDFHFRERHANTSTFITGTLCNYRPQTLLTAVTWLASHLPRGTAGSLKPSLILGFIPTEPGTVLGT